MIPVPKAWVLLERFGRKPLGRVLLRQIGIADVLDDGKVELVYAETDKERRAIIADFNKQLWLTPLVKFGVEIHVGTAAVSLYNYDITYLLTSLALATWLHHIYHK